MPKIKVIKIPLREKSSGKLLEPQKRKTLEMAYLGGQGSIETIAQLKKETKKAQLIGNRTQIVCVLL